jgi:hypothetical protein
MMATLLFKRIVVYCCPIKPWSSGATTLVAHSKIAFLLYFVAIILDHSLQLTYVYSNLIYKSFGFYNCTNLEPSDQICNNPPINLRFIDIAEMSPLKARYNPSGIRTSTGSDSS